MLKKDNQVRIVAGKWKSRRIDIANLPVVKPTKDMVRETLFNWLGEKVRGAKCLDLFAGSGALGFEALSRGAKKVVFVDREAGVIAKLRENARQLLVKEDEADFYQLSCPKHNLPPQKFDIIFLDPPFQKNLVPNILQWIVDNDYLTADSLVYIETEKVLQNLDLPNGWQILKHKASGKVAFYLVTPEVKL